MARSRAAKRKPTKPLRPIKTEAERVADLAQAIGIPERQWANLGMGKVVDLSGELGGKRMSIVNVLVNRGGTAVERWMAKDKLFEESQQRAIRYTQGLWVRAEGKLRAVDPTRDIVDEMIDGMSQQEALDELHRLKSRVPNPYWDVYENVCRFDEEAGTAGSRLASNSRSAIDAAKTTVAFTASLIAQWRRL
jgi:hypothetical protein